MGQQPNVPLDLSDLPRPRPKTAAARRWSPDRPGDLNSPDQVPWGGAFGTTGPDTGYAAKLVAGREITLGDDEDRHNAETALAALAGARASRLGRGPTAEDVDVALLLLGYDEEGLPPEVVDDISARRRGWLANLSHNTVALRELVASVAPAVLVATPGELRSRLRSGEQLIGR